MRAWLQRDPRRTRLPFRLSRRTGDAQRGIRTRWHQLAERLQSSQSRVAKMEAGDPSVSMDLLVSSLLLLGASSTDLANAIKGGEKKAGPRAA